MKNESKGQLVQSLTRALDILEYAARCEEGISLTDITELLDISQGAAYNLSNTLVSRGYLKKWTRPVRFTIGDTLIDLGLRKAESRWMRSIADIMAQLAAKYVNSSILFVTAQAYQLVVQLRTDPTQPGIVQRPMRALDNPYPMITPICLLALLGEAERSRILKRYPIEEFSSKECPDPATLRSQLETIRERQYALNAGNLCRIACPVYDANGQLLGAFGISFHENNLTEPQLRAVLEEIRVKLAEVSLVGARL